MLHGFNRRQFKEKVRSAEGLVLANFWASWSLQSGHVSSLIRELANLFDEHGIYITHVDWDQEKNLAKELNVSGVPTILFFALGREVTRHSGEIEKDDLIRMLEEAKKSLGSSLLQRDSQD